MTINIMVNDFCIRLVSIKNLNFIKSSNLRKSEIIHVFPAEQHFSQLLQHGSNLTSSGHDDDSEIVTKIYTKGVHLNSYSNMNHIQVL